MTVQELAQLLLPRVRGELRCDIFAAVREVQAVIAHRLLLRDSDLLLSATEAELAYAIDAQTANLPSDYKNLAERPYIADQQPLAPLDRRRKDDLQDSGDPRFYQVIGRTLWIYPPTDEAVTVRVPYYANQTAPTAMGDTLPFIGEFDRVFVEGAEYVLREGLSAVADPGFVALIQSQVDAVLDAKERLDEQLLADAINEQ